MRHIETENLLDTLDGRSQGQNAEELRHHLSECRECMNEFSSWTQLLDGLSHPALEDAPPATLRRAFEIFQPVEGERSSFREIVASLLVDSWAEPAMAGLRGQAAVRQLCLSAEEFDLHVRVVYDDRGAEVRGQLLPRDEGTFVDGFDVFLLDDRGMALEATGADEFGEFSFDPNCLEAWSIVARLRDGRSIKCQLPEGNPE